MTTPSSTNCSRGDVFLVDIRFSDDSGSKRRPVVVVSTDSVHESRADALTVPLTTKLATVRFGDSVVQDWQLAGLPRPSLAKGVVATVDRGVFGQKLGSVSGRDLEAIESRLREVLGL
jgi:mRNA interferase MazF